MSESYEVVFEQVAMGDLPGVLAHLQASADAVLELTVSEYLGDSGKDGIDKALIEVIIAHASDVCLTAQLHGFQVSEHISLAVVLLRVLKYGGAVDVELSFDTVTPADVEHVMFAMQAYAKALSADFHVTAFFGGLEPAADIESRYFTGDVLGPLGV
ncbi:hypothetical protein [Pseudomonas sichuanensis]|uniref:hypothetical protein n=1 Tax=Pseudomonas sichuanensis TaxID=2213015 RepID=UPI000DA65E21|nr:hypothetical protein [Pseudomonas sichuanensis]